MSIQTVIIILCVLAAILFMGRKVHRTLTQKGCSDCASAENCNKRNRYGGGECSKKILLEEIKPKR